MKKTKILSLAVAAVLCAGFASCGGDDPDEPKSPATENANVGSSNGDDNGNGGENNSDNSGNKGGTIGLVGTVADAIDLGLPSGTLWANWNVGATKPEEYGSYYAWGETEEKETYTQDNYKHYNSTYINIGADISGTKYDVAHVMWGDGWHMPTKAQIQELIDKCTWTWITYNDSVYGYKVTGPNGNRIFLPAAGYRFGTSLGLAGSYGLYWSGALSYSSYYAYVLYFSSGDHGVNYNYRYHGQSVRPVKEK